MAGVVATAGYTRHEHAAIMRSASTDRPRGGDEFKSMAWEQLTCSMMRAGERHAGRTDDVHGKAAQAE